MSSKQTPKRYHVALLSSLRAIYMMGGEHFKVNAITGRFSKTVFADKLPFRSEFANYYMQRLDRQYLVRWKAQGDGYARTVKNIIEQTELDGIPDVFISELTLIKPYSRFDVATQETVDYNVPFIFTPHPFKKGLFKRLKGRMPSYELYKKMVEMRNEADLDEETRKRWRGILLLNTPVEMLSNQEIVSLWFNESAALLLKETKGKFELMEVSEIKY